MIRPKRTNCAAVSRSLSADCFRSLAPYYIVLPGQGTRVDLKRIQIDGVDVYCLVFHFLREFWSPEVTLIANTDDWRAGEPFVGTNARSFPHITINGTRFGACTAHRGMGASYAFMDGQQAVRILHIFHARHDRRDTSLPSLETTFAIITRFKREGLPAMPWSDQ